MSRLDFVLQGGADVAMTHLGLRRGRVAHESKECRVYLHKCWDLRYRKRMVYCPSTGQQGPRAPLVFILVTKSRAHLWVAG